MLRTFGRAVFPVLAAVMCLSTAASAHVTLETKQAPAGGTYKAVLQVGHGCDGSPTKTLRVTIPEGVTGAKPMPKAGWQVATTGTLPAVTEIVWSGGSLPDSSYDEFVFRATLPNGPVGGTVYFPVVQECETGVHRWVTIPQAGEHAHHDHSQETAPGVTLTAKP